MGAKAPYSSIKGPYMKKILHIFFLIAFCGAICASTATYKSQTSVEYSFLNERLGPIAQNGMISTTIYNMPDYGSLDFKIGAVSSGSLVTANVIWKNSSGTTLFTEILRSGAPIRKMLSNVATIQIKSQRTSTVNVTGNILLTQNPGLPKAKIWNQIAITAGTTATTTTVTDATQGFWHIKTDQKIHLEFLGGTATTADYDLASGAALDFGSTNVYFKSGDTIKMIAATTTANVTGFVYE